MATAIRSVIRSFQTPGPIVVVLGLLTISTVAVTARVWRPSSQKEITSVERGPAQIVRFTVYDDGIFPSEIRVGAGLVAIYLEDRSGNSAGLVVTGETRQAVSRITRTAERLRGNTRVKLEPGRYQVYEPDRPKNSATLIVEP